VEKERAFKNWEEHMQRPCGWRTMEMRKGEVAKVNALWRSRESYIGVRGRKGL
jgi:hypothetical protein